jgi:hypothetical protein
MWSLTVLVAAVGCDAKGTPSPKGGERQPDGHAPGSRVEGLPAPEKGTAQLDGLYMIVRFVGGSISQIYHFFTPAGYAYADVPPGGLERFDFAKAAKDNPSTTGTYAVKGEKLVIKFADGKERELSYAINKEKGNVELDGLYAHKAQPFKQGTTFDGQYSGGGAVGGGTGTFVASSRTITFRPDGTYAASATGSIAFKNPGSEGGGGGTSKESGTYSVSGNTLELKRADGTTTRHTIFPYELNKKVQLNIDGSMYKPE